MRIEIYYNGLKNANNAVESFKTAGFNNSAVDLYDNYIDFENYKYSFSDALSSTGTFSDNSKKVYQMSGGMGNFHDILNSNYKVVVNTNSSLSNNDMERLKRIVAETGGNLKITI